jgi:type IV secretory pathway TrbF-like protein
MADRVPVLPHPDAALLNARRQYLERYGSALVMNSYLQLVIVCLVLVAAGLLYLNFRTLRVVQNFQPLVVRIDELGRAQPLRYDASHYQPQAPELRYFLVQFVTKHFSRMRATVERDFSDSLYFLDHSLARAIIQSHRRHGTVEQFLRSGDPEIEVLVDNVALDDTRTPPFKASVDYTKVYYQRDTRQELRRVRYTGNFVFVLRTPVRNSVIPYNPLGFTITYFREDEAFADTSGTMG